MFENVRHNKFHQQHKDIAISVPSRSIGLLLMEMASSRSLNAWSDPELHGIIWIRCNETQVGEILEQAALPAERMKVRALENLSKTIFSEGDVPPEELMQATEGAQGNYLGCLFERLAIERADCD